MYWCKNCDKFSTNLQCLIHATKNLNPIPMPINKKCQHCDFEAYSDEGILKHTSKEIENNFGRLYFCKKCNFKSCTIEDLQQHLCIKTSIDACHFYNPNTV